MRGWCSRSQSGGELGPKFAQRRSLAQPRRLGNASSAAEVSATMETGGPARRVARARTHPLLARRLHQVLTDYYRPIRASVVGQGPQVVRTRSQQLASASATGHAALA